MGARANEAHIADQHVEKLGQFIDAGRSDETADARDPIISAHSGSVARGVALILS